jgi:hypothetical protein
MHVPLTPHVMPQPPQSFGLVFVSTHRPVSQQPPLQGWVDEHAVVQVPVATSQAWSAGQSVATAHPHVPLARQALPVGSPVQEKHAAPVVPHAVFTLPGPQEPPFLQQPPLHGWLAEHAFVHVPVATSQAWSVGQSPVTAQPQLPPARHSSPSGLPTHETHPPPAPHAPCAVPGAQVPPLQHPPLQGSVGEQVLPQTPLVLSHASSVGQSVGPAHPHVPLDRHATPDGLPAHDEHAVPEAPHAVIAMPGTHMPASQQPPLHGWLDEQVVVQSRVFMSQASPIGQSAGEAHPASIGPVSVGPVSVGPVSVGLVSFEPVSIGPLSRPLSVVPSAILWASKLPSVPDSGAGGMVTGLFPPQAVKAVRERSVAIRASVCTRGFMPITRR